MNKKYKYLFIFALILSVLFSMNAFAGDAVVDILENDRFNGVVEVVNKIGKIVDTWFMAFISFVSFFIISAACLRNVLAGAYAVFPKFWDKVDEAHASNGIQQASFDSIKNFFTGGVRGATVGSAGQFLLSFLPNIKKLTDFEGAQDVDYKQYFMRAIPQAAIAVFVGVFIYNGYYRDVMVKTSQFGSEIVTNALNSVDPSKTVERLFGITGLPKTPLDNAKEGPQYIGKLMLQKGWGPLLGEYPDISEKAVKKENYNKLASSVLSEAQTKLSSFSDTTNWKISVSCTVEKTVLATQDSTSSDGREHFRYINIPVSSIGIQTTHHKGEELYLRYVLKFVNAIKEDTSNVTIQDFVLTAYANIQVTNGKAYLVIPASMTNMSFTSGDTVTIDGKQAKFVGSQGGNPSFQFQDSSVTLQKNTPLVTMIPIVDNQWGSTRKCVITNIILKDGSGTSTLESPSTGVKTDLGTGSISGAYNQLKSKLQGNQESQSQGSGNNTGSTRDQSINNSDNLEEFE